MVVVLSHDGPVRHDARLHHRVVAALGRLHLEAEGTQCRHVRFDGAAAEVAAAGVRQLEVAHPVHQRAEEHDDRAGTAGRLRVDPAQVKVRRRDDLEVVLGVEPAGPHADALQDLEQPVDLLDARDPAQRRTPPVQEGGAQQRHAGVLRGLDLDGAAERGGSGDAQVRGSLADADQRSLQRLADAREHVEGEVLVPALDAVHRALAGAEHLGQLLLRPSTMLAGVADQVADSSQIALSHRATVSHI
jgi:hypothetical protein